MNFVNVDRHHSLAYLHRMPSIDVITHPLLQ